MNPKPMSIGPKRLCGRRRYQYKPAMTGPRMKSAFCAASQPGYLRKSADRVTATAAADAPIAATRTATCHHEVSRWARLTAPRDTEQANRRSGHTYNLGQGEQGGSLVR